MLFEADRFTDADTSSSRGASDRAPINLNRRRTRYHQGSPSLAPRGSAIRVSQRSTPGYKYEAEVARLTTNTGTSLADAGAALSVQLRTSATHNAEIPTRATIGRKPALLRGLEPLISLLCRRFANDDRLRHGVPHSYPWEPNYGRQSDPLRSATSWLQ